MTNPVTRFKQNDGKNFPNWDIKLLGEVAKIKGGSSFPLRLQNEETKEIPFFKVSDMNNPVNTVFLFLSNKYISRKTAEKEKYSYFNSDGIVLAKVGAALLLDRKRIAKAPFLIDNNLISIFPKESIDLQYLYYWTLRIRFSSLSQTGALPSISTNQIEKLFVGIPTKLEQQKIASFFSTLDKKIELNERKLEALERLKKGVMQKIFSQEIRFKDSFGKSYPDWQEFSFRDLFEFKSSNSLSRSKLNYSNGYIKNIHYGDILLKFPTVIREDSQLIPYINNDCMLRKFDILEKGDIIFADTAEDYTLGKAIEIGTENITATAGLHTIVCKPKKHFSLGFLGYYLNSNCFHDQIVRLATGTKVYSIIKSNIVKTKLLIPASSQEQNKIAELFSSIDEKITLSNQKIKNLKELKKGFMQQMFI